MIDSLLTRAYDGIYEDMSGSLALLKKADSLISRSDESKYLARLSHSFAVAYYVKGEYDLSLQYYLKAQKLFSFPGSIHSTVTAAF